MSQKKKNLIIDAGRCKECGLCIEFCPSGALEFSEKFNSNGFHPVKWTGECSLCGICYTMCPDYCIEIKEYEEG
ncbi:MAG: ferredoxin family protein [Elusimicrobiota bacterium]